tara:strand:+ start:1782 stop:1997 length:216 start_codon:yes stop_codon:yes gene_type:complete
MVLEINKMNKRNTNMILNNRQKELLCDILMYYSSNIDELNEKIYPVEDPILVMPEKYELLEILRLIYESMN